MSSDRPSPLEPGYRIERYELLYAVAQGGMGSVWVARLQGKHGFERLFAIKTILPQFAADPQFRAMFMDEVRLASAIAHPNVVPVLDLGEQHGVLYAVMEWIEGESLARILRDADKANVAIPYGVVLRILADTCAGLHAAHELVDAEGVPYGVVHRDVSPQNILVSVSGISKLIDFGVAKARDRAGDETSAGIVKGKVRYIAPEQAMGARVDRRADLWAVGAVMRFALTRSTPYGADADIQVLRRILSGEGPQPMPPGLPEPLARIVHHALQPNFNHRYRTALDMQRDLEMAAVELGVGATSAEVAGFLLQHTHVRIESRRQSLRVAVEAAAERARVRNVLQAAAGRDVSSPSMSSPSMPSPSMPSPSMSSPSMSSPSLLTPPLSSPSFAAPSLSSPSVTSFPPFGTPPKPSVTARHVAGAAAAGLALVLLVAAMGWRMVARARHARMAATAPSGLVTAASATVATSPASATVEPSSVPAHVSPPVSMELPPPDAPAASPSTARVVPPIRHAAKVDAAPPPRDPIHDAIETRR